MLLKNVVETFPNICGMNVIGGNWSNLTNTKYFFFRLAFVGALIFAISDSIIALNKFYLSNPLPHGYVMMTYYGAQLLMTSSILCYEVSHNRKNQKMPQLKLN